MLCICIPRPVNKSIGQGSFLSTQQFVLVTWNMFGKSAVRETCYPQLHPHQETTHGVQPHPRIVVCPSSFCLFPVIRIFIVVFCGLASRLAISHEMGYLSHKEDYTERSSVEFWDTSPKQHLDFQQTTASCIPEITKLGRQPGRNLVFWFQ
jgi:hypothetical protein